MTHCAPRFRRHSRGARKCNAGAQAGLCTELLVVESGSRVLGHAETGSARSITRELQPEVASLVMAEATSRCIASPIRLAEGPRVADYFDPARAGVTTFSSHQLQNVVWRGVA